MAFVRVEKRSTIAEAKNLEKSFWAMISLDFTARYCRPDLGADQSNRVSFSCALRLRCAWTATTGRQKNAIWQWFPTHLNSRLTYLAKNQMTRSFTKVSHIVIYLNLMRHISSFVSAKRLKSWCNVWNRNAHFPFHIQFRAIFCF